MSAMAMMMMADLKVGGRDAPVLRNHEIVVATRRAGTGTDVAGGGVKMPAIVAADRNPKTLRVQRKQARRASSARLRSSPAARR